MIRDVLREALERPYGLALTILEGFIFVGLIAILGLLMLVIWAAEQ